MLRLLRLYMGGLAVVGIGLAVAAGCNEAANRPAAGVAAKAEPKKEAIAENEVPAAVRQAIAKAFPQATCDGQEVRRSGPTTLYFIEVEEMGKSEVEAAVTPAGAIVEVETVTELKAVPAPAARAIEKAAEGAKITEVAQVEIRAEFVAAGELTRLLKLDKPKTVYGADLLKDGRKGEIRVTADGTVVKPLTWE